MADRRSKLIKRGLPGTVTTPSGGFGEGDGIFYDPDQGKWVADTRTKWRTPYTPGDDMLKDEQVLDDGWLMIANKDTNERAAPQATGQPFYVYNGAAPTAAATAKQIVSGNRYTFSVGGFLNGYRLYVTAGNTYSVYLVLDPLGTGEITNLALFTAGSTGWIEFGVTPKVIPAGTTVDLIQVVQEPDPTPTTFTGDWNYTTPNNTGTPGAGVIIHANQASDQFRVNKTDNNLVDRSADLATLTVGDVIDWGGGGTRWAIQSIADNGTWYNFGVSPSVQESPDGNHTFTFETVTATPITRMEDANYWGLNPPQNGTVEGLYIEDGSYSDIVPNTSAYGTDVLLQYATVSDDWDVQAVSEGTTGGGGGASGGGAATVINTIITNNASWMDIKTYPIATDAAISSVVTVTAERLDGNGRYFAEWAVLIDNDAGVSVDFTNIFELGVTQLDFRIVAGVGEFTVEVRGRPNQEWFWEVVAQYVEA